MVNVQQRPDLARFEAMVDEAGPASPVLGSPCWLWTGATDPRGFPKFWLRGNAVTAQRAALLLVGRKLRADQVVTNLCTNRRCVRPGHLATATLAEARALRCRGRPRIGLGEIAVIRLVVRDGETSVEDAAWAFGLSPEFVEQIVAAG